MSFDFSVILPFLITIRSLSLNMSSALMGLSSVESNSLLEIVLCNFSDEKPDSIFILLLFLFIFLSELLLVFFLVSFLVSFLISFLVLFLGFLLESFLGIEDFLPLVLSGIFFNNNE